MLISGQTEIISHIAMHNYSLLRMFECHCLIQDEYQTLISKREGCAIDRLKWDSDFMANWL